MLNWLDRNLALLLCLVSAWAMLFMAWVLQNWLAILFCALAAVVTWLGCKWLN